jgi:hypothetical protein
VVSPNKLYRGCCISVGALYMVVSAKSVQIFKILLIY